MRVTVAICTWNRSSLLGQTLARMESLQVPDGVEWELLVVNNNSTDDTDSVIADRMASGRLPIRRLFEPKQGHSNARNCACAAATGDLLIWTDDDVLVEPDWVRRYVEAAEAYPDAAFFGGPVRPWFEAPPPPAVQQILGQLQSPLALLDLGDQTRRLADEEYPLGANMAFRTDHLKRYPFRSDLGRCGGSLMSGDDIDVLSRMQRDGLTGVWVAGAALRHFVPSARMVRAYLVPWYRSCGRTQVRRNIYRQGRMIAGIPLWVLRAYVRQWVRKWVCPSADAGRRLSAAVRVAMTRGMIDEYRAIHRDRVPASPTVHPPAEAATVTP